MAEIPPCQISAYSDRNATSENIPTSPGIYRVWEPRTGRIVRVRDVIIDETAYYDRNEFLLLPVAEISTINFMLNTIDINHSIDIDVDE
jgi:hypothetical protein